MALVPKEKLNFRFVQIVDGMDNQAPGMNFSLGNIAGMSELDVESIEFLPGPSSARHGGNILNGLLIMNSKDPFKFEGLSFYVKPGVSDVKSGSDAPFQFTGKGLFDAGFRYARAINDKFAFKIKSSKLTLGRSRHFMFLKHSTKPHPLKLLNVFGTRRMLF